VSPPETISYEIAVEGAADFFFGRPFDENPYSHEWEVAWRSWRAGWLDAASFEETRGDVERRRWLQGAA
jgi:hypothetical protein